MAKDHRHDRHKSPASLPRSLHLTCPVCTCA
jgi:hypothetical protein